MNQGLRRWHECCITLGMNTVITSHPAAAHTGPALNLAELLGADAWAQLSPAIQRRFAAGHGPVRYAGQMQLRCSPLGRVFAALAQWVGSPLAGGRASQVNAQVQVRGDGRGGVVWARQLGDEGEAGSQAVRSTKRLGPDGQLEECTDGGLSMTLGVCVEAGALVFYSRRYFWLLGGWRLPVPALFTPGVCRVEHRDEGPGRFRFTLDMRHPLWGHTFHQTGVFLDPVEC